MVDKKSGKEKTKGVIKRILYVAVSILGVITLILLIIPAFFRVLDGDSLARQEEELAKLEKYYQDGNYEEMSQYLTDIDKNGGDYEKYVRLCELYVNMNQGIEKLEGIQETEEIDVEYLQETLQMCMHDLSRIAEMEELNFPYNEEQGATYIRTQYEEALKQYMRLTEDEIATAVASYVDENTDYMELAEIASQRIEEQRN